MVLIAASEWLLGIVQSYLSSQFPGWPTVPVHRMMMFVDKEAPAQKEPPLKGQVKELIV